MSRFLRAAAHGALLAAFATPAAAELSHEPPIVVVGQHRAAVAAAEAEAAQRPGNVTVVPAEVFEDSYAVSFRDTLAWAPGVVAQPRFGEEVRLSVRGSGLSNNSHLRGVELLFDGVPITGADGFGDFQEIDPLFASHLVVRRGANAFETGAATLGGAIEIAALTGRDMDSDALLRLDGGSFGTSRLHARLGGADDQRDWLFAGTWQRQDGFRSQSTQDNGRLYASFGWRWSPQTETRVGALYNAVNQEIPGALTRSAALSDPTLANPNNTRFDFARDINAIHVWTRTTADLGGAGEVTAGASYTDRKLLHPISVVVDQKTQDALAFLRWRSEYDIAGRDLRLSLGARARRGEVKARTFAAVPFSNGAKGAMTGDSLQTAEGLDVFGEAAFDARENITLVLGANWTEAKRDVDNRLNPAASDGAAFSRTSPKLGLIWAPRADTQVFANIAASFEPPTFSQLTQSGVVDFVPIAAQKGVTAEIGARYTGEHARFEIAYYDARLEDEFAAFVVDPSNGLPAATFNAENTIHRGIEAFAEGYVMRGATGALTARINATWSDFRFDGDRVYGDNRLPAAPSALVRAALIWEAKSWRIGPNVEWRSGDTYVDYANTLKAPGHTIWGLEAAADINPQTTLFLDVRNLADRAHVSTVSALANAQNTPNPAVYTPGEDRGVFVGLRAKWGS